MNWQIEYKKNQGYVLVVNEGEFSAANNLKLSAEIISRDFWQPGMNVFFDHRKLSFTSTTLDVMREAGNNLKQINERIGDGKAAILMKSMSDFASGRQFEMLVEFEVSAKIRIFLDEKQALLWLLS